VTAIDRSPEEVLTPARIVEELDRYVVGQREAKRAVAVALRNRWRRQQVEGDLRDEIAPKNIIMIGPTGVGKTEIARRLARLANSPFLKIEASKFTEVGYVGRDVESMIRDLVEIAIDMVREEKLDMVAEKAESSAEERILDLLLPPQEGSETNENFQKTRDKLRTQLREGKLDDRSVEVEVRERSFPSFEIISSQGIEEMDINIKDMLPGFFGPKTRKRKTRVAEAIDYLIQEEEQKLVDMDQVTRMAVERAQLRPQPAGRQPDHAALRRRHAVRDRGHPPLRRGDRSDDRRDALDVAHGRGRPHRGVSRRRARADAQSHAAQRHPLLPDRHHRERQLDAARLARRRRARADVDDQVLRLICRFSPPSRKASSPAG